MKLNEKIYPSHTSTFLLPANIMAALVYVLPAIIGVIFEFLSPFAFLIPIAIFFIEKKSKLVRFHALQYIMVSLSATSLSYVLYFIALLGGIFLLVASLANIALTILLFVCLIVSVVEALRNRTWQVPYLGKYASQVVKED